MFLLWTYKQNTVNIYPYLPPLNDFDLDICCQDLVSEKAKKDFSRRLLTVKMLLTKEVYIFPVRLYTFIHIMSHIYSLSENISDDTE